MSNITKEMVNEKIEILNHNFGFDISISRSGENKYCLKAVEGEVTLGIGTLHQINFFLDGIQQGAIMGTNPLYTQNAKKINKPVYPNSKFPVGLNNIKNRDEDKLEVYQTAISAGKSFERFIQKNPKFFIIAQNLRISSDYSFEFAYVIKNHIMSNNEFRSLVGICMLTLYDKDEIYGVMPPVSVDISFEMDFEALTSLKDFMYVLLEQSGRQLSKQGFDPKYMLFTPKTEKKDIRFYWTD